MTFPPALLETLLEARPEGAAFSLDDFADTLAARDLAFPVIAVDVRRRDDVLMLVEAVVAQAEARAAVRPRGARVDLVERLEHAPELIGGHADPRVAHGDPHRVGILLAEQGLLLERATDRGHARLDGHVAARGGELDRVAEQVHEHALDLLGVGHHRGHARHGLVQLQAGLLGRQPHRRESAREQLRHGVGVQGEAHRAALELRHLEQLGDERQELLAALEEIAGKGDLHGALALLNAASVSRARFTGMYRIEGDTIYGIDTFDREHPVDQIPVAAPAMTSYCLGVFESDAPFATPDSLLEARLATHVSREVWRSYAGVPMRARDGRRFGTICHYDHFPSQMVAADVDLLLASAPILAVFANPKLAG